MNGGGRFIYKDAIHAVTHRQVDVRKPSEEADDALYFSLARNIDRVQKLSNGGKNVDR